MQNDLETTRRKFLKTSVAIGTFTAMAGVGLLPACSDKKGKEKDVSPPEDLMQEHGLLNRVLLIYDFCKIKLAGKESFPVASLLDAASIIKIFVEDYHEKQEENYLFPRFQKANQLTDLVTVLQSQHYAGRRITGQIIQFSGQSTRTDNENQKLIGLLTSFITMYRPHETREDTILFPAFRKIVSQHEYDSIGEEFEKNEHIKFGEDGFETMVSKVADIEKKLSIYDLAQFTPSF